MPTLAAESLKDIALACGFDLVGLTSALPSDDYARFEEWRAAGFAGEMTYLTDRRGDLRSDPRNLLPSARTVLCVGKLYTRDPSAADPRYAAIAGYARGDDYHDVMRAQLQQIVERLQVSYGTPFEYRICVDTAPLLERSLANRAGLGWIGKNTCLINQQQGSFFLLAELLLSLELATDTPPPDRCGSCRRCVDACPTAALVPDGQGRFTLDSRLCISYLTIEKRGELDPELEPRMGTNVFGCDICQDVCPWNTKFSSKSLPAVHDERFQLCLEELSNLGDGEFRQRFRGSAVWRAKYTGFSRNVAVAMGNSGRAEMMAPLKKLSEHPDLIVAAAAKRSYLRLQKQLNVSAI